MSQNCNGYDLDKILYTEFIDSSKNGSMINVLDTTPNRRARSTICLIVRGSDGSEQALLVSGYDDSSEMGRRLSIA